DIAARVCEARNDTGGERVSGRHHDRDRTGRAFRSQSVGSNGGDNDVDLLTNELTNEACKAILPSVRISVVNTDVLSLNPSELTQSFPKSLVRSIGMREGRQKTDLGNFLRLLRLSRNPNYHEPASNYR